MAEKKISYRAKNSTICPVCETEFNREELLSGGGRMNAGELTDELHRKYLPTEKYGEVYPLIYPVSVCPGCYYAAYQSDFESLPSGAVQEMRHSTGDRKNLIKGLEIEVDFSKNRSIVEGVASYLLALNCYEKHQAESVPTFRQALSALRGAWLCMEYHEKLPGDNWDYLAKILYRKSSFLYSRVVENEEEGVEQASSLGSLGPDIDNNYGFDGVLYLAGLLEYKYGQRDHVNERAMKLKKARSTVARIVGMGKSSKAKPGPLLDSSRELHKKIKAQLDEMGIDA